MKKFISHHGVSVSWLPKDNEVEDKMEWLNPRPKGTLQASLDYAKQLSDKLFRTVQSVTTVTTLLPKQLQDGASKSYQYTQEMYSTLKPVSPQADVHIVLLFKIYYSFRFVYLKIQTPMDLSASGLNKISFLLDTQLGYVSQLGSYLSSVLQVSQIS